MTRYHTIIVLTVLVASLAAGAAGSAAGQQPTPANQSAPPGAPGDVQLVVDDSIAIVSWTYTDGAFSIDVYSSEYTTLTLAGTAGGSGSQGTISFKTVALEERTTATVRIQSSTAVSLWSEQSREQGRAYYLRKSGGLVPSGPFSGDDVRNAGIGGAGGVAIAVLYGAVSAKLGARRRGERVA